MDQSNEDEQIDSGGIDQRPQYLPGNAADAVKQTFGSLPSDIHRLVREAGSVFIRNLVVAEEFTGDAVGGHEIEKGAASRDSGGRRVLATHIDKVNTVFTPASFVPRAWTILRDRRVVILRGEPGVGKATAAIHLLTRCAVKEIRLVDPGAAAQQLLSTELVKDRGYLLDGLSAEMARGLTAIVIGRLQGRLAAAAAYLVLTVDTQVPLRLGEPADLLVTCDAVEDLARLVDRHIDWYLRDRDPATIRRRRPGDIAGVNTLLQSRPPAAELDRLGMLLARAACGDITEQDVVQRFAANAMTGVHDWFAEGHDLAECALLIAVAALGGASCDDVTEAAGHLERQLVALDRPQHSGGEVDAVAGSSSPSRTRRSLRLAVVHGHLVPGEEMTPFGPTAVQTLRFENPAWHSAVLEHVWGVQATVRASLLEWLRDRCRSERPAIRVMAAFAVGELCTHEFTELWSRIVAEWAGSPDERLRTAAALASSVPACSDTLAPKVLRALLQWSADAGSWRRRWTAAAAFGSYWIGLRYPDVALRGLELVAWSEDMRLLPVLTASAAGLFALGPDHQVRVLRALDAWCHRGDRPAAVRRSALFAFIKIAVDVDGGETAQRGIRWPALLALMDAERDGAREALALWTRSLDDRGTRELAEGALRFWIRRSESDETIRTALVRHVYRLALAGGERGRLRLVINLEQWANHPTRPSPSARALADALRRGF